MKRAARRRFLKTTTVAALGAPFVLRATRAQEPVRKLGFALCGLGSLSTHQIAPALQKTKHARLVGVITGTPAKAEAWKAKYSIPNRCIYNYDTMDRLADNPDIDVVYVVTPNALHAEHTIQAARAGKHVLCEKPMEVSVRKCHEMIAACEKARRRLAIGYRCQFVPHHLEMMRLARDRDFGGLKFIEASFGFRIGDPNQWRLKHALAGGGALMDVGVYALQGARYLTGTEPTEVTAVETRTDPVKFKEVDESIAWTLRFPGGVVASCGTSYNADGMNRLFAAAESGWFELNPAYSYGDLHGRTSQGPLKLPQIDHFAAEIDDFADCILTGRRSRVEGEEGLRDVKIMMAIYESIRRGRPVKLT